MQVRRFTIFLFALLFLVCACKVNERHSLAPITVAFYNVENLFDTLNAPGPGDDEFLPASEKKWTSIRYQKKLEDLAKVVNAMALGGCPALLGLCEVENRQVVYDLMAIACTDEERFEVVHYDSPDHRGIDNALVYDSYFFELREAYPISLTSANNGIWKTRDILYARLESAYDDALHVFVNHFPSRLGGLEKTEPNRLLVSKVLRQSIDSVLSADQMAKIIVMGDFNDEPHNISIAEILTEPDGSAPLINTMAQLDRQGLGTYRFRDQWNMLDQILISEGLHDAESGYEWQEGSEQIHGKDWMLQDSTAGKYEGYPNRTYGGNRYLGGFSDHLPVSIRLKPQEKIQ